MSKLNTEALLAKDKNERMWFFLKGCIPTERTNVIFVMLSDISPDFVIAISHTLDTISVDIHHSKWYQEQCCVFHIGIYHTFDLRCLACNKQSRHDISEEIHHQTNYNRKDNAKHGGSGKSLTHRS